MSMRVEFYNAQNYKAISFRSNTNYADALGIFDKQLGGEAKEQYLALRNIALEDRANMASMEFLEQRNKFERYMAKNNYTPDTIQAAVGSIYEAHAKKFGKPLKAVDERGVEYERKDLNEKGFHIDLRSNKNPKILVVKNTNPKSVPRLSTEIIKSRANELLLCVKNDYIQGILATKNNLIPAINFQPETAKEAYFQLAKSINRLPEEKQEKFNNLLKQFSSLHLLDKALQYSYLGNMIVGANNLNKDLTEQTTSFMFKTIREEAGKPAQKLNSDYKNNNTEQLIEHTLELFVVDFVKFVQMPSKDIQKEFYLSHLDRYIYGLANAANKKGIDADSKEIKKFYTEISRLLKAVKLDLSQSDFYNAFNRHYEHLISSKPNLF